MASNPAVITCTADTWVAVATNVVTGRIYRINSEALYMQTIRLTGEAAPTTNDDGAKLFADSNSEAISSSAAIDVYVKALNVNGSVRVDL